MSDDRLIVNGVSALTGQYLVPAMTLEEATARARGPATAMPDPWPVQRGREFQRGVHYGPPPDVHPEDVRESGWAIVFAKDTPDEIRRALGPLIEHRRKQVPAAVFKELEYWPGKSREEWLATYKVHGADVVPEKVPYYVLLVGGPDRIPFDFQFLLDIDYAVGRLAFDHPEDYARYAEQVVRYETADAVAGRKEVVYWAPRHDFDPATELSHDALVTPLYRGLPDTPAPAVRRQFGARGYLGDAATRTQLLEVLHGPPPAVLFTASHGVGGWPVGDARQRPDQGGLLGQEWSAFGEIARTDYLTGADVGAADLGGLIAFCFACYGAGTPRYDSFLSDPAAGPSPIAPEPFVAALPQRLLASGALAVVGHVDRGWGYSIRSVAAGPQIGAFRNLLLRLLIGQPVGHATLDLNQRFATASASLLGLLDPSRPEARQPADPQLVGAWIERNDAQSYVVLGDPAVRIRVDRLVAPAVG